MSHTTRIGKTTFVHDDDFDGTVRINARDQSEVIVPIADIWGFVAEILRYKQITKYELENRRFFLPCNLYDIDVTED